MRPEEQIALFVKRVSELRSRRLFKQGGGLGGSLNLNREVSGPPYVLLEVRLPDEEDLRSFLLVFRQFVLQTEPVFINKIYNICYQTLEPSSELRERLAEWYRNWKQTGREITVGMQFKGQTISPEELADLWINGYYFHNDADKYDQLENLFDNLAPAKVNFLTFLINATREIDHLGHLIAEGMKDNLFRF
jgi:hypothetical protein